MIQEFFSSDGWDENGILDIQLYSAECLQDFGIFKKGEQIPCLGINLEKGYISAFDDDGQEVKKMRVTLKAVEE